MSDEKERPNAQCGNLDPHHPHWRSFDPERYRTPGRSGWVECHGIKDPNCPTCKGEGMVGGKTSQANDLPWPCGTCLPNPGLRPDLAYWHAAEKVEPEESKPETPINLGPARMEPIDQQISTRDLAKNLRQYATGEEHRSDCGDPNIHGSRPMARSMRTAAARLLAYEQHAG